MSTTTAASMSMLVHYNSDVGSRTLSEVESFKRWFSYLENNTYFINLFIFMLQKY